MISAPTDHITKAIQNVLLARNPIQSKLQGLENDMKNIERTDLQDDVKINLYRQSLQKYLQFDHARKTEPVSVKMSTPEVTVSGTSGVHGAEDVETLQHEKALPTDDVDSTPQILKSVPKHFIDELDCC